MVRTQNVQAAAGSNGAPVVRDGVMTMGVYGGARQVSQRLTLKHMNYVLKGMLRITGRLTWNSWMQ